MGEGVAQAAVEVAEVDGDLLGEGALEGVGDGGVGVEEEGDDGAGDGGGAHGAGGGAGGGAWGVVEQGHHAEEGAGAEAVDGR